MLKSMLFASLLVVSFHATAQQYPVDCWACEKVVDGQLSPKFLARFPADNWKVAVSTRIFRMGNGSLKGVSTATVMPITAPEAKNFSPSDFERRFKKTFMASKTGGDIAKLALNNPALQGEMFDEPAFRRAANELIPILIAEAIQKMVAHCEVTPDCDLYIKSN